MATLTGTILGMVSVTSCCDILTYFDLVRKGFVVNHYLVYYVWCIWVLYFNYIYVCISSVSVWLFIAGIIAWGTCDTYVYANGELWYVTSDIDFTII